MRAQYVGVERQVQRFQTELHEGLAHHRLTGLLLSEQRRRLDQAHEQVLHPRSLGGYGAEDLSSVTEARRGRVPVEEAHRLQPERDGVHGHHRPLLRPRDVVDSEHVPEHHVGVLDRAATVQAGRPLSSSLWTGNSPQGQRSSSAYGGPTGCARRSVPPEHARGRTSNAAPPGTSQVLHRRRERCASPRSRSSRPAECSSRSPACPPPRCAAACCAGRWPGRPGCPDHRQRLDSSR